VDSSKIKEERAEWKTPLFWTIAGVSLGGAFAVVISPGADPRWIPALIAIFILFALPEIVKNPGRRRFGNVITVLACLFFFIKIRAPIGSQPHPVIKVSATYVSYKPESREVDVAVTFVNLTTFEIEAHVQLHLLWGGPRYPDWELMSKNTEIIRDIAMGPHPDTFTLWTSCILPLEAAQQYVDQKALIMVGASADYVDQGAGTEYAFAGNARVTSNTVDVVTDHWFKRPTPEPF